MSRDRRIPGVGRDAETAILAQFDRLRQRLDLLERKPAAPAIVTRNYTARAGQFVRVQAPAAGLTILLPKPSTENRGAAITFSFESEHPVTLEAVGGLVNGERSVVNTWLGTFSAISNGYDQWAVGFGISSDGPPASAAPAPAVYSVTLAAGTHSDYVLPPGFANGDTLNVTLTGDAVVDGIVCPGSQAGFVARIVVGDSSGGIYKLVLRGIDFSASTAIHCIRTPGETDGSGSEDPDFILGPSEEEGVTLVYVNACWRVVGSTWRPKIRKFDNTHAPVARYDFEASLADSSGNGLTLVGVTPTYREVWPGVVGMVSGTPNRGGTSDASLRILGDLTVEALLVMRVAPVNAYVVAFDGSGELEPANYAWALRLTDQNTLYYFSENGAGVNADFSSNSTGGRGLPALGVPFHVAMRRASGVITFFVNGRQFGNASAALTAPTGATSSQLAINDSGSGFAEIFGLKIVASALTDAQIRAEYNRTLGGAFGFV